MPSPPSPLSQKFKKEKGWERGKIENSICITQKNYLHRNSEKILHLKRKQYGECLEIEDLRTLNSGDSIYYRDLL